MSELVVVGGLNMDLHVFELRGSSGQAPLIAERYLAQPGGKGGNVARAAARLGASVHLVARVGNDEFGRECVAAAARDGVDTSGVCSTADAPTGFVLIELVEGRHRSRVFAPGANDHLDWADVEPHLAHLSRGDVVIAQAEIPAAVLDALGNLVSERGLTLFLDPTPPNRVSAHHLACAEVITPDLAEA
ncbi:MAG: hypothetical protein KDB21_11565, partial [Acidimicrobiales bacterium]|nr:hypothetical protein [Acidimicrobiales bacterium]